MKFSLYSVLLIRWIWKRSLMSQNLLKQQKNYINTIFYRLNYTNIDINCFKTVNYLYSWIIQNFSSIIGLVKINRHISIFHPSLHSKGVPFTYLKRGYSLVSIGLCLNSHSKTINGSWARDGKTKLACSFSWFTTLKFVLPRSGDV